MRCVPVFLATVLFTCFSSVADRVFADEAPRDVDRQVDALFAPYAGSDRPGVAVAIAMKGQLVYSRGYGMADLEHNVPVTPSTVFNIASCSKQFTAFLLGLLAAEGKVDLGADIHKYLRLLPDAYRHVTVDELIHHTSGIREYTALAQIAGYDDSSLLRQAQVIQVLAAQKGLNFTPGTQYEYSNSGYALLARIVEAVSGQSLRALERQRIFEPLHMGHTRLRDTLEEVVPNYAVGYQADETGKVWQRATYNRETVGAGNVVSTAEDLIKWTSNFSRPLAGDRRLMTQMTSPGRMAGGASLNYGFGLFMETVAGRAAVSHTGSVPGFIASLTMFPGEDFAIVLLANARVDYRKLTVQITSLYLGKPAQARPDEVALPEANETLAAALVGHYQSTDSQMITIERQGRLLMMRTASGRPEGLTVWSDGTIGTGAYDGRRLLPIRSERGGIARLLQTGGSDTSASYGVPYVRVEPASPSRQELRHIAGTYYCAELDRTFRIEADSHGLTLRSLWMATPQRFIPGALDRFDATPGPLAGMSQTVQRDRQGNVVGLAVHAPGVANLALRRIRDGWNDPRRTH